MELLMPLLGMPSDSLSTILQDQDTVVTFSRLSLSTSLYHIASRLGKRFAKKREKDVDVYEAEALYALVEIANLNENLTIKQLRQRITKELYKYLYTDHTVAASQPTIWRNKQAGREDKTMILSMDFGVNLTLVEKDRPIEFLEMLDDVCRTAKEKEYVRLIFEGKHTEEIAKIMKSSKRIIHDIRSGIVQKLQRKL